MLELLKHLDTELFLFLNGLHNSFFDVVMWWLSNKWIWIPLYAVLAFFIVREYKWNSIYVFLGVALLITLTDQLSVHLFKDVVQRYRPTHNPKIKDLVHVVNDYRGGSYGFVSSHATSVFSLSFLLSFFLKRRFKYFPYFIFAWATIVSYSRIYLGVHYPGDVICGALFGLLLAFLISCLFRYIKPLQFYKEKT